MSNSKDYLNVTGSDKTLLVHNDKNLVYNAGRIENRIAFRGKKTSNNVRGTWTISDRTSFDLEFLQLKIFMINTKAHQYKDEIQIGVESTTNDDKYELILTASQDPDIQDPVFDGVLNKVGNTYQYVFPKGEVVNNDSILSYNLKAEKAHLVILIAEPVNIMDTIDAKKEKQ